MEGLLEFLLGQGWVGVAILGGGWLYLEERRDRKAAQDALDKAREAHHAAVLAATKETAAAIAAIERAIVALGARGGRDV